MPQQADYQVDPLLTSISVGYQNAELIHEQLFPRLTVPAKNGYYYTFNKENFRIEDSRREGLSRAKRIDFGMTLTAFGPLVEHSLEEDVQWKVRDTYPTPMDAYTDSTNNVTEHLELALEKEVADKLQSNSVVTNGVALLGTDRWNDYANSDPFTVIQAGIDDVVLKGMVLPNVCTMGYQVWSVLKNHPDLLGRLSVNTVRTLTPQLFAELFGFEKVLIGKAMYNAAKEGQAASMGFVWGKNMVLSYVPAKPGLRQLATGYTLRVKDARVVDRWSEPGIKADFVRCTDDYEPKFVSTDAAYLIRTVID